MYSLENVHVVLLEPQRNVRRVLKYELQEVGFRDVYDCGSVDNARSLINAEKPELLLLDLDGDQDGACTLIRDIRYRRVGHDPFLVIIAVSWRPEREMVHDVMKSGVDDMITKPVSVDMLSRRIDNMIEKRKKFVATETYFGPDRRQRERLHNDDELPLVQVPNSLRHLATGDETAAIGEAAEQAALAAIALQRVQREAMEIMRVAEQMEALVQSSEQDASIVETIDRMVRLAHNVADYFCKRQSSGLVEVARSLAGVIDAMAGAAAPTSEQIGFLRLHSEAVCAVLMEQDNAAEIVARTLDHTVVKTARLA